MEALVGEALFMAGGEAVGTAGLFGAAGSFGAGGIISGAMSGFGGTLLQGLLTGASAFGQIQAGNMQGAVLESQARQSEISARMELLRGRQQALTIKSQLEKDLSSQNAVFAARGSSLAGEGSAQAAREASIDNATQDLSLTQFGATMASESDRLEAAQSRTGARAARSMGRVEAMNTVTKSRSFTSLLGNL